MLYLDVEARRSSITRTIEWHSTSDFTVYHRSVHRARVDTGRVAEVHDPCGGHFLVCLFVFVKPSPDRNHNDNYHWPTFKRYAVDDNELRCANASLFLNSHEYWSQSPRCSDEHAYRSWVAIHRYRRRRQWSGKLYRIALGKAWVCYVLPHQMIILIHA